MYSLMPAGLHGNTGLDPQTAVHVFQIYVLPVLLYGREVAVPSKSHLDTLEKFFRSRFCLYQQVQPRQWYKYLPVYYLLKLWFIKGYLRCLVVDDDSVEKRDCVS